MALMSYAKHETPPQTWFGLGRYSRRNRVGDIVRLGCLLGSLLLLLLSASSAGAAQYSCRVHFGDDVDLPSDLEDLLEGKPGAAVRVCGVLAQSETIYRQELSKVTRGPSGACQFTQRNIFPTEDETGLPIWSYRPPWENDYLPEIVHFMLASDEPCPRQDDLSYTLVSGVSDGLFMALVRFWERFSSPEHLEDILSRSPSSIRHYDGFESLERLIVAGKADHGQLRPSSIRFADGFYPDTTPRYEITAYPPTGISIGGRYEFWVLSVDLGEDGFRLLSISVGVH